MDASSDGFQVDKCDYLQVRCRQDKKARAKPSYVQSMKVSARLGGRVH